MPPARRRPIPGMAAQSPAPPPPSDKQDRPERTEPSPRPESGTPTSPATAPAAHGRSAGERARPPERPGEADRRRVRSDVAAADYAATRLVNFRIPVDLHDRYRRLVREAEQRHPRLRRPSLTELVIALLEEGPATPDEVAELIRRKRAAEHARRT